MMKTILARLKSPVVIGEIIVAGFALATAFTGVDYGGVADKIVAVVVAVAAVFAAMNNPTDRENF